MYKKQLLLFVVFLVLTFKCSAYEKEILVEADSLHYDKNHDITIAKGNVIIKSDGRVLKCEIIHYHRANGIIFADENITITNPDNSVYFASKAELNQSLCSGKIVNFTARFKKNSLFTASDGEILKKNVVTMNNVVFSPCEISPNNFLPNKPTWQVKASSATLNKEKEIVIYKNARVEFLGIPVLYTPYLSTPSPHAKRKSGFLTPKIKHSNGDTKITIPYYINMASNKDIMLNSIFSNDLGIIAYAKYRHLLKYGNYFVAASYTEPKSHNNATSDYIFQKWRGHLLMDGVFNIADNADVDIHIHRIHDKNKTYLAKYNFHHYDVLHNNISYIYDQIDKQIYVRSIYFQDLREQMKKSTTPGIYPNIQIHNRIRLYNMLFTINSDFINLKRKEGTNYTRGIVDFSTKYNKTFSNGQILDFITKLQFSAYHITQNPVLRENIYVYENTNLAGSTAKIYPEFRATWYYPIYKIINDSLITIEPIIDFVSNFSRKRSAIIPNEDSQIFELSPSKLFDNNRYYGFDKSEIDNRVNYGIMGNLQHSYLGNTSFLIGQTYRFTQNTDLDNNSGIHNYSSDIITGVYLQANDNVAILQQMRLDNKDLQLIRNELYVNVSNKGVKFSLNYMGANKKLFSNNAVYKREFNSKIEYNVYDQWWVNFYNRSKLGKKKIGSSRLIKEGVELKYKGRCIAVDLAVERDYTKLKDLKPSTTYSIDFNIPVF